jgi:hypothetical protein
MSDDHQIEASEEPQYEPPAVEDLDAADGPAVTAAGITVVPS